MLLIAEVKEIVPARYGFKAVIKHVPDQAFAIDEQLYRRLDRRFEPSQSLWGAADNLMVMIATFGVSDGGLPTIAELSLMPVTGQWLPIEDSFEQQLIERLVQDGHSFVKGLRYKLALGPLMASATLTDTGDSSIPLCIAPRGADDQHRGITDLESASALPAWVWRPSRGSIPPLPRPLPRLSMAAEKCPSNKRAIDLSPSAASSPAAGAAAAP